MSGIRIALANVVEARSIDHCLEIAVEIIAEAARQGAAIVCFPECFMPGYRIGRDLGKCDGASLERAWGEVDRFAKDSSIAVIMGTERLEGHRLLITARVTNRDGTVAGFQDKVQLDPSEEGIYSCGTKRRVFRCGELIFGVVICHEGWRYPETVRWAVRQGAHVVFHPHTELVEDPSFRRSRFADANNSFHEKAALCRAAENTCYFATVNHAIPGAATTSAIIAPDGTLLMHQPYAQHGLLVGDIDLSKATRLLANRLRDTQSGLLCDQNPPPPSA